MNVIGVGSQRWLGVGHNSTPRKVGYFKCAQIKHVSPSPVGSRVGAVSERSPPTNVARVRIDLY